LERPRVSVAMEEESDNASCVSSSAFFFTQEEQEPDDDDASSLATQQPAPEEEVDAAPEASAASDTERSVHPPVVAASRALMPVRMASAHRAAAPEPADIGNAAIAATTDKNGKQQQHQQQIPSQKEKHRAGAGARPAVNDENKQSGSPAAAAAAPQEPVIMEQDDFPVHNDDNDDDDDMVRSDASSAGDSSSSSSDDDIVAELSLQERRMRNMKRNRNLLESLGIAHGMMPAAARKQKPPKKKRRRKQDDSDDEGGRGMLLSSSGTATRHHGGVQAVSPTPLTTSREPLHLRYPGREAQIRKLSALLSCCCCTATSQQYIPPPIFVTGSQGTGKTSIVRDVVHAVVGGVGEAEAKHRHISTASTPPAAVHASIDCATLDVASIEELVVNAYCQFEAQVVVQPRKKSVAGERLKFMFGTELGSKSQRVDLHGGAAVRAFGDVATEATTGNSLTEEEDGAKIAVKRRQSARNSGKRAAQEAAAKKAVEQAKHEDIAEGQQHSSHSTPTAVWMFGRAMESLLLPKLYSDDAAAKQSSPAAFFTIDHAERLMTLGSSKSSQSDRISFLAQLLLLPRTLGLNLTFIIITKSVLLEHTCKCNASGNPFLTPHTH